MLYEHTDKKKNRSFLFLPLGLKESAHRCSVTHMHFSVCMIHGLMQCKVPLQHALLHCKPVGRKHTWEEIAPSSWPTCLWDPYLLLLYLAMHQIRMPSRSLKTLQLYATHYAGIYHIHLFCLNQQSKIMSCRPLLFSTRVAALSAARTLAQKGKWDPCI